MVRWVRARGATGVTTVAIVVVSLLAGSCASPATLPTPAGVRVRVDTTFYVVPGTTRREWLASMHRGAEAAGVGRPYLAHTGWQTRWSYQSSRLTARGCMAVLPVVDVTIGYVIPKLRGDSGVAPDDLREWQRHWISLWRHEEGHSARAMRAAAEMRDSLASVRTPTCGMLQPVVSRAVEVILSKYREQQRLYDARTGHGARQGAILILPEGARIATDTAYRDTLP